jgi:serine/threonine-protein kinase
MELLEGRTLAQLLEQSKVLGLLETCEILLQACDGVSAAHQTGIVHRDLKPENLFLLKGPRPFVKILDFGISKFDPALTGAQGITMDGSTLGTPFYMPPEQVRGDKSIDLQADIYSLGVILYECLAGARPFEADTLPHLAVLIAEGKYVPPRVKRPELPADADAVVARAMAPDRSQRYRSVDELRAALAALRNSGAHAGPASMNFGATLVAGSPGSNPPPGAVPSTPPTAAPSWSAPPPAADAPLPSVQGAEGSAGAKAPAHTASPFSRTTGEVGEPAPRSRSIVGVVALLALAAGAIGAGVVLLREPAEPAPATGSPTSSEHSAAAPPAVPVPSVAPSMPAVVEVPVPAASSAGPSSKPAAPSPSDPARQKPQPQRGTAGSRAQKHGLSEENPF